MTHNQSPATGIPCASSPTGAAGAPDDRSTIFNRAIDALCAVQERRHAWLADAAVKIERWKAEDAAAGMPWGESQQGAGDSANNAPGHIR